MKVSLSWLKDYVEIPANLSPQALADCLTFAGTEVEHIETVGGAIKDVIVARVTEIQKHPNADKLSLCKVDTGKEVVDVVCGAANVRKDLTVAFAPVGSVLPGDFKIKAAKIRGSESFGMICSEKELGLSAESDGIMELPPNLVLGMPLVEALQLIDHILTLAITPNRPDLLGHVGVAREYAALLGLPLKNISNSPIEFPGKSPGGKTVSISVADSLECPSYWGRVLKGVKALPSPPRIRDRLTRIGLRPINILVDATNYVAHELGQPTHAFDLRFVKGATIAVRSAGSIKEFKTLDGKVRMLLPTDLMIFDAENPIALAGVMGGENSQILADTVDVLLEVAYFQPRCVRKTARRLGVVTDSSYRFERGVDPHGQKAALDRLTQLILAWTQEVSGACPEVIETVSVQAAPSPAVQVSLALKQVNETLGVSIEANEVGSILQSLGVKVTAGSVMACQVPSFRPDLRGEIDLIEEVARIYGYDKIPETLPKSFLRTPTPSPLMNLKSEVAGKMKGLGFCESITFSFLDPKDLDRLDVSATDLLREAPAIANPLAADQSLMRTTLLPALLHSVAYNINREQKNIRLFEIGKVFFKSKTPGEGQETHRLCGVMTGNLYPENWAFKTQALDYFDSKAVIETVFNGQGNFPSVEFCAPKPSSAPSYFHPGQVAALRAFGRDIGFTGMVHPQTARNFDISAPVFAFDIDLTLFLQNWSNARRQKFHEFSLYPSIRRDLALVVNEEISAKTIQDLVVSMKIPQVETVFLFDLYRGKPIAEGKKSLAFAVMYNAGDRTLTHEEVDRVHAGIIEKLGKEFAATLRS